MLHRFYSGFRGSSTTLVWDFDPRRILSIGLDALEASFSEPDVKSVGNAQTVSQGMAAMVCHNSLYIGCMVVLRLAAIHFLWCHFLWTFFWKIYVLISNWYAF
jgi:hypothetical protein